MPRASLRVRRWLAGGIVVGLSAAAVTWLAIGQASGGGREQAGLRRTAAPPPAGRSTTTTTPGPTAVGTYPIGTTTLDVVDSTVPLGAPPRQLPTTVWFPAIAPTSWVPDRARAPYPLLVFSQGFATSVLAYAPLIEAWASAGFVVAAPTYPDTDPSSPTLAETDIVHHPADLHAVITTLLQDSEGAGSVLSHTIATGEIGLVGQSDGGDVSLAVGDNSADRYSGVKAVAVLSGAELASLGGTYFASPVAPLLVVQGSSDAINPPSCSLQIYDAAPLPKYYLDLLGASHLSPYITPGQYERVVAQVTTDFFEAELTGRPSALGAMVRAGNVAGVAAVTVAGTAPATSGSCPGAP